MTTEEIIERVNVIFRDVLENPAISLNKETTANDIREWDSINHILLIVQIEKEFNISFKTEEVGDFKNVGEMCDAIGNKVPK